MGKYSTYTRTKVPPRPSGVHPVMRGIGCIMIVIVPILSYGIAILLVNYGTAQGWPIPPDWYGAPSLPPILEKVQGFRPILQFLRGQINLEAYLAFTLVMIIVIGGIMTLIYGWLYTLFGPPKYGPQDAPPIKGRKVKPYKR
jgi:hypothetical protein